MTENEAHAQAFENGRKVGDAEGYARGKAEAVKHGRWVNTEYDEWECSECQKNLVVGYDENPSNYGVNFCSCCGARMDGGSDA